MRKRSRVWHALTLGILLGTLALRGPSPAQAQTTQTTPLTGVVTSAAEGAMEGVLVSAQAVGSPITTTVVTDEQGRYSFPAGRLAPGRYQIRIRAVGYDLSQPIELEVAPGRGAAADLTLVK